MNRLEVALTTHQRGINGLILGTAEPDLVEMAGLAGFAYVILDEEHGAVWPRLSDLIRAAHLHQLAAIVRAPEALMLSQALDRGADGVMVPGVRTSQKVAEAVNAVRYPPRGQRGLSPSVPAAQYGWAGSGNMAETGANARLWLQIETREALEELPSWAENPDIDLFFVGPTDLSMDLGERGAFGPHTQAAVEAVAAILAQSATGWGMFADSGAQRERWVARGAQVVATTLPAVFRAGADHWRGDDRDA